MDIFRHILTYSMAYLNTTCSSNLRSAKLRHTTIYGNQGYNRQNMDINNF